MATYTHAASAVPSSIAWYNVVIGTAPVGTPTSTLLVRLNSDGTETRIIGTGFTYSGATPTGGTVTEIQRTSSGGATVYETVTGLGLPLTALTIALQNGNRSAFAYIFQNADTFNGFVGDDFFVGGSGADNFVGGSGTNTVSYDNASALVQAYLDSPGAGFGDAAGDSYSGIQNLIGSDFHDLLAGNSGVNTLTGGSGHDVLIGGAGADILIGGAGNDAAGYWNAAPGLIVDLAAPGSNTGEAVGDTYVSIEGLHGSVFNDILRGDANGNFFSGGAGADTLDGRGGFDFALYDSAGTGVTADLANSGNNTGEAAGDIYISIEGLDGSAFNDILRGDANGNFLEGRGGADVLDGGAGFDAAGYQSAASGLIADLATPGNNTGEAAGDSYISIEGLWGGAFNDTLRGDANNNSLNGGAGADILEGGAGADQASYENSATGLTADLGTPGNNTGDALGDSYVSIEGFRGSVFNDTLRGDANNNFFIGGLGSDVLDGGGGFDTALYQLATASLTVDLANPGNNTGEAVGDSYISIENLRGGTFNDTLRGDSNNNQLEGMAGADILDGGTGLDTSSYQNATAGLTVDLASTGNNTGEAVGDSYLSIENLRGGAFSDTLRGDAIDNQLEGGAGADVLDGGLGSDTASYQNAAAGLTVSLATPGTNTGDAVGDSYLSIEGLVGSSFNDTLIGDANANFLRGNQGADTLDGGAGFDFAQYGAALTGVTVSLTDQSVNTGEAAGDVLISIEGLDGSGFNDTLIGDAGGNYFLGMGGSDVIAGMDGNDTILGGDLGDSIFGGTGVDTLVGEAGNDLIYGDQQTDYIDGRQGSDQLFGGDGVDVIFGDGLHQIYGFGSDTIHGEAGDDILMGELGDHVLAGALDIIYGDAGNDIIFGGGGNDHLFGGEGADVIDGGEGSDFVVGGTGADILVGSGDSTAVGGPAATSGGDLFSYSNINDGGDTIYGFDLNTATGNDGIDLSSLFNTLGYAGNTPRADGFLYVFQNGANTDIYVDATGAVDGVQLSHMVTLDHIVASSLTDGYFLF